MAEKILNTRILMKVDTLENWQNSTLPLKKGELAFATVAATAGTGLTEPVVMVKIGEDGVKTFKDLSWNFYAKASDVLAEAKDAETLEAFVNGVIAKAGIATDEAMQALAKRVTDAEGEIDSLQAELDTAETGLKARVTTAEEAIEALNGLVGSKSVKDQIDEAIAALDLDNTYDAHGAAAQALVDAKAYADEKDSAMNTRVEALEAIDHEHANADVLNGITAEKVAAWDEAKANVQADWAETDESSDAYIKNKPDFYGANAEYVIDRTVAMQKAANWDYYVDAEDVYPDAKLIPGETYRVQLGDQVFNIVCTLNYKYGCLRDDDAGISITEVDIGTLGFKVPMTESNLYVCISRETITIYDEWIGSNIVRMDALVDAMEQEANMRANADADLANKATVNANAIEALQGLVGNKAVADQIADYVTDLKLDEAYDAKGDAAQALTDAKAYTDEKDTAMNARMQVVEGKAHEHANSDILDGITAEKIAAWDAAEGNVQADWNETDDTSAAYIKNKPAIGEETYVDIYYGSIAAEDLEEHDMGDGRKKYYGYSDYAFGFEAGREYRVVLNNEPYQVVAKQGYYNSVGDENLQEYPFDIYANGSCNFDTPGKKSIVIQKKAFQIYDEALSDQIARTDDVSDERTARMNADDALQGQITTNANAIADLSGLVGSTAVVDQINTAVAAEAEIARAAEKANADAIKAISDDYLKAADKTELEGKIKSNADAIELLTNGVDTETVDGVNDLIQYVKDHGTEVTGIKADIKANTDAIAAEKTRAEGIEGGLETRLAAVEADYLKGADKTELQNAINAKAAQTDLDDANAAIEELQGKVGNTSVVDQINAALKVDGVEKYALATDLAAANAEVAKKANDADLSAVAKSGLIDDLTIGEGTVLIFDCGGASV